jgi:excisionase family DNA binding protein
VGKALPSWASDVLQSLEPLLTRRRAAEVLRCSEKSIDRRIRCGELEATRSGGRVLLPRAAVVAHLVEGR